MHALILSDLHLGARNCQHQLIIQRLAASTIRTIDFIILNGDVVDHLNFEYFRTDDWSVLARLRQLSYEHRLVVVQGNHDRPRRAQPGCMSNHLLDNILNVDIQLELTIVLDGEHFLLTHGDQYDQTMNMSTVGYVAEAFYRQTQRWHQPTSRWLKRQSKQLLGIERAVRRNALNDARQRGYAGIILGHTHYADDSIDEAGCRYLNTGSWVDDACSYLEMKDDRITSNIWYGSGCATQLSAISERATVNHHAENPSQWTGVGMVTA